MATITNRLGPFTGHVGPVRFTEGVAETEDPDMVAYFEADPDTYDVDGVDLPANLEQRQVAALERGMPHALVAQLKGHENPDTPKG